MEEEVYLIKEQLYLGRPESKSKHKSQVGFRKTLSPADIINGQDTFLAMKLHGWITTRSSTEREIKMAFRNGLQSRRHIVETSVSGDVLDKMLLFLGNESKLRLEIQVELTPGKFEDKPYSAVLIPKKEENQIFYSIDYEVPQRQSRSWLWNTGTTKYSAMISLIVLSGQIETSKRIKLDQTIQAIYEPENVRHSNRKLMEEKIGTDTTIITGEGTAIECHKCFLISHSSVFIPMLKGNFEEGQTHQIKMEDISDRGVRAFLGFLYCKDLTVPYDNSEIAVELLMISHKYQIVCLENAMKALLTVKPWGWFNMSSAIQLYFFAKNLDALAQLRDKSLLILKVRRKELVLSDAFKELFENEEKRGAARELCSTLITM